MAERIRIMHVLPWIAYGGVERRRLQLIRGLPDRFEQQVLCLRTWGDLADEFRAAGCQVHVLDREGGIKHPGSLLAAWKAVRAFRPTIVHGAVFEGITMAVVGGRLNRVPIVVVEETSHAVNRSPRGHLLFRALAMAADRCVAVSPEVGDYLADVTRVPRKKIEVIPNGVVRPRSVSQAEIDEIRGQLGAGPQTCVIGSVGRMEDETHKRFGDLLEAIARVSTAGHDVRAVLVGDGKERPGLEALSQELGIAELTHFVGYQEDVDPWYAAMDVFALASEREAFGLVLVEAMFAQLPVVATAVGGMKRIVVDGETGRLVKVRDVEGMAKALGGLCTDEAMRRQMGERGHQRAEEKYSTERYVGDVIALYDRLIAEKVR